ncbi:4-alpha-glucanotransferase [Acetobacterium bakii]|uniref:4-alpha-glucanotransferase n=1 Tax=Acetobacterium bakii TaxID=52689 RepID=A0A0L6U2T6_9FIRM|nr:4-alpha-glucanotransferase [Acetobacterium bakii]KNZ42105.1 4-alpha-glucanotransferase [Acetobacterium bakii]
MPLTERASGVLMHISSLPGDYGIGTLGREAKDFVDLLALMDCAYWQILPLGPTDNCHSPYKSTSAFAGNTEFIDLEILSEWGLLTKDELVSNRSPNPLYWVNFQELLKNQEPVFKLAFQRLTPELKKSIREFEEANRSWLPDFALYTTLTQDFSEMNWTKWKNKELVHRKPAALSQAIKKHSEEIDYHNFLQYAFYRQWSDLKTYANTKGIKIIGDIPIYVALESADVWSHSELFQLDADGTPLFVAGVPPDYFSPDGQLWGNPLYHWATMKADGYSWWMDRIKAALKAFDLVRIDHFRGFSAYWSVPASETTAKKGQWVPGPGMDFFNRVFEKHPKPGIIAEDLGVQDEALAQLLSDTGLPGMRLMEFAFIDKNNNIHLPHNYTPNMVTYTGTHDNNTLLGTLFNYTPEQRNYALKYCGYLDTWPDQWQVGGPQSPSCRSFIRSLWQSAANLVIIPIQDVCGYGDDTRMNQPGTARGNWSFRMTKEGLSSVDILWMKDLNRLYHRTSKIK